jgi:hypothetical protein
MASGHAPRDHPDGPADGTDDGNDDGAGHADAVSWREQRRISAEYHARSLQQARAGESARARELVADFTRAARERGIPPEPLRARTYDGRRTCRTSLTGWYVRSDRTLGVGVDGRYYVLTVPTPGLLGRWRRVTVEPVDPPLVVGVGARDGESRALADLLRERLEQPPA